MLRTNRLQLSLIAVFAALLLVIPLARSTESPAAAPSKSIDFNRDIRPIFSENCYACHGPDKNKRKADLRLDTKDGLFSVHDDRPNVIPAKPDQSELFRRITTTDPAERMPDPKSNKKLADRQIA